MQHKMFIVLIAVLTLSTLACGLTAIDLEDTESIATDIMSLATQMPDISGGGGEEQDLPGEDGDADFWMGEELPDGYPESEFPLYRSGSTVVLGALRQDLGDSLYYNVVVGTDDDPDTVTDVLIATFEDDSTEFENLFGTLMGVKGGWEYTIIINSGEADGYATLITYALTQQQ